MTVESFTQTQAYTIVGVGPYAIEHPYLEGTIVAKVLIDGIPTTLDAADFSVAPASSITTGNLLLSAAAATTHDGRTLWIERVTPQEQGWAARTAGREAGMEAQLDQGMMASQEDRTQIAASLRARKPMDPFDPEPGRVPMVRDDGNGWQNGPTATEVEGAQAAGEAAAEAALLAGQWASEDEDVEVAGGKFSAYHYMLKSQATLTQVAAILDTFDDRFLGALASDPATDNDGDPLVVGATYFNTTTNIMRIYNGSSWQIFGTDVSLALLKNNALSELAGLGLVGTALSNLGFSPYFQTLIGPENLEELWGLLYLGAAAAKGFTDNNNLSINSGDVGTRGNAKAYTDAAIASIPSSDWTQEPIVPTSTGTTFSFPSLPNGIDEVEIGLLDTKTNSNTDYLVQLGVGGTIQTTGYNSRSQLTPSSSPMGARATNGLIVKGYAANSVSAMFIRLKKDGGNGFFSVHNGGVDNGFVVNGSGSVTLSGTLDTIRISNSGGLKAGNILLRYK